MWKGYTLSVMKHLLFTIFLLSISTTTFGQLQFPFPNDPTLEATWYQRRYIPADPADPQQTITEYIYSYNNFGVDTIDGIEYNRLYQDWQGPIGHYRVDGSKVYYRSDHASMYSNDEHGLLTWQGGGAEYLMYDFGLSVGDTFEVVTYGNIILTSIDSILVDGIYLKTFHFDVNQIPWYQPLEYYWIEGIGSSTGFYPVFDYFEDQLYFHCFWDINLTYFTNGYDCFDTADVEEEEIEYSIYPNPVLDILSIEKKHPDNVSGSITNLSGQVVLRFELSESQVSLNVENLKSGIYLLHVNEETRRIVKD
jgi:hypothetical protein